MGWGSNLLIKKGKDVIACLNSSDQVALFKIYAKYSHIRNLQLRKNDYLCRTEFFYITQVQIQNLSKYHWCLLNYVNRI